MKLFKKISFLRKSQIYVISLFIVIFAIAFISLFLIAKVDIKKRNDAAIKSRLVELDNVINSYFKRDKLILNLATNIADDVIHNSSIIEENKNKTVSYSVVDPYTNSPFKVKVNEWLVDNISIINNFTLVDKISNLTRVDISIYQKTDKAYVNISTSIQSLSKERMLGDIIMNNSQIVSIIEKDNRYIGRQLIDNFWYQVSYKPLYIDGQIKGLYYLRTKEQTGRELKKLYKAWSDTKSQIQFLITENGEILAHPNIRQGTDFSKTKIFQRIKNDKRNYGGFEFVSDIDNKKWALQYSYNEITRSYICVAYDSKKPFSILNRTLLFSLLSTILFAVLFQILFRLANKPLKEELRKLKIIITSLINNQAVMDEDMPTEKEFRELANLAYSLTGKYRDLSNFAEGLANNNFSQEYPKSLVNDKLGETLSTLNDKLRSTIYNENIRKKEEQLKVWETEGVSKFVNILQRNRDDLEELSYQLISNLVQYLDANIGALFFINTDNPKDVYFEQMATYAFGQQKYIDKKIYSEEGYISRIFNEKETIYLTEIPEDYIKITSGLGQGSPKSLLIVPLLINKEVYGAIEIASFNVIKGFQIEFIEKMAENIASTMNNVLVNNKTKELLNESRKRADNLSLEEEKMRTRLQELEEKEQNMSSKMYANIDVFESIENTVLAAEISSDGRILFVNDLLIEFFKIPKEEILDSHYDNYSNYVSVSEYKKLVEIWRNIETGNDEQTIIKIKSGDDEMKEVLVSIVPKLDDEQLKSVVLTGVVIKA